VSPTFYLPTRPLRHIAASRPAAYVVVWCRISPPEVLVQMQIYGLSSMFLVFGTASCLPGAAGELLRYNRRFGRVVIEYIKEIQIESTCCRRSKVKRSSTGPRKPHRRN
jgi:hypothetical protein